MSKANTICIDFDWTLCSDDKFGKPNVDAVELIKKLYQKRYEIIIYTSRVYKRDYSEDSWGVIGSHEGSDVISPWLERHGLNKYISKIIYNKPEAVMYIDDRALRYAGKRTGQTGKFYETDKLLNLIEIESKELLK